MKNFKKGQIYIIQPKPSGSGPYINCTTIAIIEKVHSDWVEIKTLKVLENKYDQESMKKWTVLNLEHLRYFDIKQINTKAATILYAEKQ